MRRAGTFALVLTSVLALCGCGSGGDDSVNVQTTTVTASPETTTSTSKTKSSEAKSPIPTPGSPQQKTTADGEVVIGHTEAPGQATPSVMNKTIASCGDPSLHETGTTFFTDGTSGWTQTCANKMMAARPAEPAPASGDSYYEGYNDGYSDAQDYDYGYEEGY